MPGTVRFVVTAAPIRGRRFDFGNHDTFLFGRAPDCHARLDATDATASRHHFLLEVSPPLARLRDLGSLNGTRVVPLPTTLRIAVDCLEGLPAAHEAGFVHRDLKPDTCSSGRTGPPASPTSGLAKSLQQAGLSGLTATGTVGGTFPFMAREQLTRYREARPTTDVWSMAATLYFLLAGEHARDFGDRDPIAAILRGGIVPLRRRDGSIPEDLAAVIDRALDDEPARRFPTAREFGSALKGVL